MAKVTTSTLDKMKAAGEKFVCITAYDATFARRHQDRSANVVIVAGAKLQHGARRIQKQLPLHFEFGRPHLIRMAPRRDQQPHGRIERGERSD